MDGLNPAVKNYTWGSLPYDVQTEMAAYLTKQIKQYGTGLITKIKASQQVQGLQNSRNINITVIVEGILKEIENSPIGFMENVFDDRKAGP